MATGCARQKSWDGRHPCSCINNNNNSGNNYNNLNTNNANKFKDVFAELSRVGYEAAYVLSLQSRLEALEKHHSEEKMKQNKLVLRELVKKARARILEVNGIVPPGNKQSWKHCLQNLTPRQLQLANVNLRLWPEIVEILSPSAVKLNDWVHGYTSWQAAKVIDGMNSRVQSTWAELFKMTHEGESFEDYTKGEDEPIMDEDDDKRRLYSISM